MSAQKMMVHAVDHQGKWFYQVGGICALVMLRGIFSKSTAYVGVVTGILGIISVAGPIFVSALSVTIIITSALTIVWVLLVGYKLIGLGKS